VSAGGRVIQLYNVGNVIRWSAFILQSSAANNPRTDADFPAISYLRLNNDQLFLKRLGNWEAEMRERYGFGTTAVTKDAAGFLDTGVYVLSDYMVQHGFVTEDGPRDQYLVTVDATLYQFEAAVFGATASLFTVLQNEIKPKDAQSLYSLNVV
jgi:DNA relaxase NicK